MGTWKESRPCLGNDEVLIELKFEPNWETGGKERIFVRGNNRSNTVEADLNKISNYSLNGKHCHFVMIDENNWFQPK
jgi:hypothetical protein